MSPDGERWDAKVFLLKEMVHHVEEEKIFRDARETLSEQRMKEIGERFESEEIRV